MAYPGKPVVDEAIKCVDTIIKNVNKIERVNGNGGMLDIDSKEIEEWQERILAEKLAKLRCASHS